MSESFDVIVVGARCAGAPLATMLAQAGVRVCLVDKDRFPSDTLSTHAVQPCGVQVLERIGVLDSLLTLAPPMVRGRMVFEDSVASIEDIVAITGASVLSVRRIALDEILVNAAAEAGAEVRTGTTVTGLIDERGRVNGGATTTGELRAQWLSPRTAPARRSRGWSGRRSITRHRTDACSCGRTTKPIRPMARCGSERSTTTPIWSRRATAG